MRPDGESRRPTMVDVAKAAGVSTALVSIVMRDVAGASEETRERVRKIAAELGYVPDRRAQKLRRHNSGQIGVTFELHQPFHGDLVEHLYPEAADRGFELVLSAVTPTRDEAEATAALIRERCEAAVMLGTRMTPVSLDRLAARLPTQIVARESGTTNVGSVRTDDVAGIAATVDHLAGLGHRRIAYIDGGDAPGSAERVRGFRDRMTLLGLADLGLVIPGGPTETDGVDAVARILEAPAPRPTAIAAFNDRCAIGVMDALLRRGVSVPGRVSVMGYDDSRVSRMAHIQLSTVTQDVRTMAQLVLEQIVSRIAGGPAEDIVLEPELQVRSTTGPAPSQSC